MALGLTLKGSVFLFQNVFERREAKEEKEKRLRSPIPPLIFALRNSVGNFWET